MSNTLSLPSAGECIWMMENVAANIHNPTINTEQKGGAKSKYMFCMKNMSLPMKSFQQNCEIK